VPAPATSGGSQGAAIYCLKDDAFAPLRFGPSWINRTGSSSAIRLSGGAGDGTLWESRSHQSGARQPRNASQDLGFLALVDFTSRSAASKPASCPMYLEGLSCCERSPHSMEYAGESEPQTRSSGDGHGDVNATAYALEVPFRHKAKKWFQWASAEDQPGGGESRRDAPVLSDVIRQTSAAVLEAATSCKRPPGPVGEYAKDRHDPTPISRQPDAELKRRRPEPSVPTSRNPPAVSAWIACAFICASGPPKAPPAWQLTPHGKKRTAMFADQMLHGTSSETESRSAVRMTTSENSRADVSRRRTRCGP